MKNGINTAEIGKKLMECSVFKAKILTKSSIKIANASLFEILYIELKTEDLDHILEELAKEGRIKRAGEKIILLK